MPKFNIPAQQYDQLLKMAGSKLGIQPEVLKSQLESGNLGQTIDRLGLSKSVNAVLNSPDAVQQMLNDPKTQALIRNLCKKGR